MAGQSEYEAFSNYARPVQAALHFVTRAKLGHINQNRLDIIQALTFEQDEPAPLRRRNGPYLLHLEFTQHYRIIKDESSSDPLGPYRVTTTGYYYSIADRRGSEILAFHWHPDAAQSARDEPHLHVKIPVQSKNDPSLNDIFSGLHIPTERVTIEAVVRFLIEQLDVTPSGAGWKTALTESEAQHRKHRS